MAVGGHEILIVRPRNSEELLDEDAFEHDEFLPYWAELWPSARVLADAVGVRALRGRTVLELGCGLGLPSIAAALAGGRVTASDWSPESVVYASENARRNGVDLDTVVSAWAQPDALVDRAPWSLVIASDVLYEQRNVGQLLALLPKVMAPDGEAWIADPGRRPAAGFIAGAVQAGWEVESRSPSGSTVRLHKLRRAGRAGYSAGAETTET